MRDGGGRPSPAFAASRLPRPVRHDELQSRVARQCARLSQGVGPPFEEPFKTGATAAATCPEARDDAPVVELPDHPPVLTPGLARALGRVIVKASRAAECNKVRASDAPEVLAS